MQKQAKITSKGRSQYRARFAKPWASTGDRLVFESVGQNVLCARSRPEVHFPNTAASVIRESAPVARTSACGCAGCAANDHRN